MAHDFDDLISRRDPGQRATVGLWISEPCTSSAQLDATEQKMQAVRALYVALGQAGTHVTPYGIEINWSLDDVVFVEDDGTESFAGGFIPEREAALERYRARTPEQAAFEVKLHDELDATWEAWIEHVG